MFCAIEANILLEHPAQHRVFVFEILPSLTSTTYLVLVAVLQHKN